MEKEAPTWEEVLCNSPEKETEKEDSDWDEDTRVPVESQFEDATMVEEICMDTVEESTVEAPPSENIVEALPSENIVEALVGLSSQDEVQIHTGNDNDLE